MKRTLILAAVTLAFGTTAYATTDDPSAGDVTVAAALDDAAAANNNSVAIGHWEDYSTNVTVLGIAVADSELIGVVTDNFNATEQAVVLAGSGDNYIHDGGVGGFKGIAVISQNTGNAALTQQSVVVQANVN